MKILRVYTGEDGKSHFEDLEIDLPRQGPVGRMSELQPGEGVIFRSSPADYDSGFHNAPAANTW